MPIFISLLVSASTHKAKTLFHKSWPPKVAVCLTRIKLHAYNHSGIQWLEITAITW